MKTTLKIVLSLLVTATYALAAGGTEAEGLGFMTILFIAFGVLIVMFQFVPGLMLFATMLRGIFSPRDKKAPAINSK